MSKRMVFVHPDGLHQIIGHTDAQPPVVLEFVGADGATVPFEARGRVVPFASLVKVTPRMAVYREPLAPQATKPYDRAQR